VSDARRILPPGALVRRLLGDRLFSHVVERYRSVFVNLDEVAACIPTLPAGAEILDVGGGDGALLDRLLRIQPHVRATLVDQSPRVGLSLDERHRERVRLLASRAVSECAAVGVPPPQAIVISDVLHHVPPGQRLGFLREVAEFGQASARFVAIKEVAPEGWRARLGLLSDWYVTGDRHVELIAPEELVPLVLEAFPGFVARPTRLLERDAPNYCIVFEAPGQFDGATA
jgi:hypothetical protein